MGYPSKFAIIASFDIMYAVVSMASCVTLIDMHHITRQMLIPARASIF